MTNTQSKPEPMAVSLMNTILSNYDLPREMKDELRTKARLNTWTPTKMHSVALKLMREREFDNLGARLMFEMAGTEGSTCWVSRQTHEFILDMQSEVTNDKGERQRGFVWHNPMFEDSTQWLLREVRVTVSCYPDRRGSLEMGGHTDVEVMARGLRLTKAGKLSKQSPYYEEISLPKSMAVRLIGMGTLA